MDPERARELLAQERERIERALGGLRHTDTGEEADEIDPGNLASDLYQDELDEGLAAGLHQELAAVERAEARLAGGNAEVVEEDPVVAPVERVGRQPAEDAGRADVAEVDREAGNVALRPGLAPVERLRQLYGPLRSARRGGRLVQQADALDVGRVVVDDVDAAVAAGRDPGEVVGAGVGVRLVARERVTAVRARGDVDVVF